MNWAHLSATSSRAQARTRDDRGHVFGNRQRIREARRLDAELDHGRARPRWRAALGQDLALNSLAAAILGGVNFGNGRGGMAGPAVAAFMLTFLFNFLTSLGLGEPGRLMLQGAIIASAALAYSLNKR